MVIQNFAPSSASPYHQQKAISDWVDWPAFACPFFVTLTFKQCRMSEPGVWQHLSRDIASSEVCYLLKQLSRQMYGNASWRNGRRVPALAVAETSPSQRLHYHLIVDCPRADMRTQYVDLIPALWRRSQWADKHIDVQQADSGALAYVLKLRTKPNYLDAFDWFNTHRAH